MLIIAELGINHNGDLDIAKKLVLGAKEAGADAVKFQKRTIDLVYSQEELASFRESPWGSTQREQKEGLEFGKSEYDEIDRHCAELEIDWFASAWDVESQIFLRQYSLNYNKVASAMLTNTKLLETIAEEGRHTFISTGMHSLKEIGDVVDLFRGKKCPFELMHCCSAYPMPTDDANLRVIDTLRNTFKCDVGYSGHEVGLAISVGATMLGITSLERHITLDRSLYGSDQSASVELGGFSRLIGMVRVLERAMGDGKKRITEQEKSIRLKLAPLHLQTIT